MNIRIISRLDIKGSQSRQGNLFRGVAGLGKPEGFARKYNEDGADELISVDAMASLKHEFSSIQVKTTL